MKKLVFPALAAILAVFFLSAIQLEAADTGPGVNTVAGVDASNATGAERLKNAVAMYVGSPTGKVTGKTVRIDALNMKVRPVNKDSLTYVPARFMVEGFGGSSVWDSVNNTATFSLGGNIVGLAPFSDIMEVNGKQVKLPAPVEAEYGRILVPADAFAAALGKQVFYNGGLIIISDTKDLFDADEDGVFLGELAAEISQPPAVGSQAALKELLGQLKDSNVGRYYVKGKVNMLTADTANKSVAAASENTGGTSREASAGESADGDYSATNVQVEGVDEADVVKTDGEYIYQVNGKRIIIARAYPGENMEIASVIGFSDSEFSPRELYADGKYLTVIGGSRARVPVKGKNGIAEGASYPGLDIYTVKAIIYDIGDKKHPKVIRETELDGGYISSRKIGDRLYLLANRDMGNTVFGREWQRLYLEGDYNGALSEGYDREFIDNALAITEKPVYRDTAAGEGFTGIPYDRLYYFPDSIQPNYLVIASLDIANPNGKADISAYLGAGENMYASLQSMYISFTDYESCNIFKRKSVLLPERNYNTVIYKFSLEDGIVRYRSKGTVPGSVLNQFSMDEDNGFFRVATTSGNIWGVGDDISKNNVYILDDAMGITGGVEDMAPGERIYSVRFAGDRAYVVTFRKVDPLFVLDLKNSASPKILGSLKIPGYSDYLHPYDENHIIGFGKETVEIKGQAYYQGMKIAMFDITDVTKPVRKFSVNIGDRGTESELLENHKALLFSREKGLMAFPVTLYEADGKNSQEPDELQYGSFTFQGAYIYQVDPDTGFKLKGRITHLTQGDYMKAGDHWRRSARDVGRILYIDDTLYTLSQEEIRANSLDGLKETGSLKIP